jgi:two-component system, chemotaxis family, sensor kinase CheA
MAPDPYRYFRLEARELLDQFGEATLALEKGERSGFQVQRLLRLAHTLKGAARVVKQAEIADQAHAIEDELAPFRESDEGVPRERVEAVLGRLDEIEARVVALSAGPRTPTAVESTPAAEDNLRTVRADLAEMDVLLEGLAETHSLMNGLRPAAQAIEHGRHLTDLLLEQLAPHGATEPGRQAFAAPARAYSTAEELRKQIGGLERKFGAAIDQMDRELRQLRGVAEQLRLVSAGTLFVSLERTARDAAQALGKTVAFEGHGGGIRLDAYVLGVIQSALVQIVRNAVAHGIESEAERRAAGKAVAGRIIIDVSRRGRRIVFECRDDGRGIDLEAVRVAASRRGSAAQQAARLDSEALIDLLLRGGLTTSEAVTDVSGRGIGLDVVRDAVAKLGGEVACRTQAGEGAIFELTVPLSLAAVDALVVEACGAAATIPFDAVRRAMLAPADAISRTADGATIVYDESAIPFIPLPKALHGMKSPAGRSWSVVVVAGADGLAAVGVDRLLGSARVVMRPLPPLAAISAIVAGASLDTEGNPQFVLDPDGLVAEARRGDSADFEAGSIRRPVLIIDDSLTTRMLEQSILESAGYEVDVAVSGEEALEKARQKRYALFLVDVEMPGMDGFGFIETIRLDPVLRDIPAVLVTSRNAPEDLQRGRDVGAQGHIVKSEFNQAALLAMIRRLMDR